eukprot:gene10823-840_t
MPTKLRHKPGKYDTVSMIAGGAGLTPMLHLLRTSLDDPEDKTKLNLLFCNKSQKDIILREELEELQRQHPDRFKLHLMIDRMEPGWEGLTGFPGTTCLKSILPQPSPDHLVCLCGPDKMMQYLGGATLGMTAWSKTLGKQPSGDAANEGAVGGVLGSLGFVREHNGKELVYCF